VADATAVCDGGKEDPAEAIAWVPNKPSRG